MNFAKKCIGVVKHYAFHFGATVSSIYLFSEHVGSIGFIVGRSMSPTLNPYNSSTGQLQKNIVLINKMHPQDIDRDDIVIFVSPQDPDQLHVKRIIGLEGEIFNDQQIPQGHVWVQGDNKHLSVDSNQYGPIPKGLIKGKVTYIIWPKIVKM